MYFIRAIDVDELPQWQQVRTTVYLELGFISPDQLNKDGLFVDGEDDRAHHIAAFDMLGQMIGTFRLIQRQRGRRLPVERDFGIRTTRLRLSAELSGLAILSGHRNGHTLLGLLRGMYDLVNEFHIQDVYAELEKPLLFQMTQLGFPFVKVGESSVIYHTVNWPVKMFVSDIMTSMAARDSHRNVSYAPFFFHSFDGWITEFTLDYGSSLSSVQEA